MCEVLNPWAGSWRRQGASRETEVADRESSPALVRTGEPVTPGEAGLGEQEEQKEQEKEEQEKEEQEKEEQEEQEEQTRI